MVSKENPSGAVPVKLFIPNSKPIRLVNTEKEEGTVPVNVLLLKSTEYR